MYALGANHGFLIRDAIENGSGLDQRFNSREKGSDNPPRLVLTFGPNGLVDERQMRGHGLEPGAVDRLAPELAVDGSWVGAARPRWRSGGGAFRPLAGARRVGPDALGLRRREVARARCCESEPSGARQVTSSS